MGASPSIGLPDLGSLTNKGASIRKKGTHRWEVLSILPTPEFAAPIWSTMRGGRQESCSHKPP